MNKRFRFFGFVFILMFGFLVQCATPVLATGFDVGSGKGSIASVDDPPPFVLSAIYIPPSDALAHGSGEGCPQCHESAFDTPKVSGVQKQPSFFISFARRISKFMDEETTNATGKPLLRVGLYRCGVGLLIG